MKVYIDPEALSIHNPTVWNMPLVQISAHSQEITLYVSKYVHTDPTQVLHTQHEIELKFCCQRTGAYW